MCGLIYGHPSTWHNLGHTKQLAMHPGYNRIHLQEKALALRMKINKACRRWIVNSISFEVGSTVLAADG